MDAITAPTEFRQAYAGKRVLVTGHTGFKGGWLTLWLAELGARVTGYALDPETNPSLFDAAGVGEACEDLRGDVRDFDRLREVVRAQRPDVVFHLAAQPLVRRSYAEPLETLGTNVMGTANLLEAIRVERVPATVVVVTSDKCYENRETPRGYREDDPMGGHDVYSMSKGASELVVASYRRSFFPPERRVDHGVMLASARAGNVIGGGDWSVDRIVPDAVRALAQGAPIGVRNPAAVRPWQHVVEPLGGYLLLGARLAGDGGDHYCEGFNFGPEEHAAVPVGKLADAIVARWGDAGRWQDQSDPRAPHEAKLLMLNIEKAEARLGWRPRWGFGEAVSHTIDWYKAYYAGTRRAGAMRDVCVRQIAEYARAIP